LGGGGNGHGGGNATAECEPSQYACIDDGGVKVECDGNEDCQAPYVCCYFAADKHMWCNPACVIGQLACDTHEDCQQRDTPHYCCPLYDTAIKTCRTAACN
jgi:hypothetical protein